jgi:hypothetical protein
MGIIEILAIVLLVMLLLGALPAWPHSRNWGVAPVGGLAFILLLVILLVIIF